MSETEGIVQVKVTTRRLFAGFFLIGAGTIGGGYVMIPLIQRDLVEKKRWLDKEEFLDLIALAQSVPGVIAINVAAVTGYRLRGYRGAAAAALGAALPSVLIILAIARWFFEYRDSTYISSFFAGAQPAVAGLLVYAAVTLGLKSLRSGRYWLVFLAGLLALTVFNVHPIAAIVLAGISGYFWFSETGDE